MSATTEAPTQEQIDAAQEEARKFAEQVGNAVHMLMQTHGVVCVELARQLQKAAGQGKKPRPGRGKDVPVRGDAMVAASNLILAHMIQAVTLGNRQPQSGLLVPPGAR